MRFGSIQELKQLSLWSRVLGWLCIFGWCLFVAALIVFHYARPEQSTLLTEIFSVNIRDYWRLTLADVFVLLLLFGVAISTVVLAINFVLFRQNRQHIWLNNIVLLLTCVGSLAGYFIARWQ